MAKKSLKVALLVAVCGSMMGFGGGMSGQLLFDVVEYAALEFVLDNDSVFDLFQDDFGTGTQYDDRFTGGDATRVEPVDAADAGQNFSDPE
jgi:hypothetical protein